MQNKILIIILENQTSNSTETNYFNALIKKFNELKNDLNNILFNKKNSSIDCEIIENEKGKTKEYWEFKFSQYINFIKPNIIYGIIDNDDDSSKELALKNFSSICKSIKSCYKNDQIFLIPPEYLTFEYFMLLHVGEKGKIPLDKEKINQKLKIYFNKKDLKKIKTDKNIFMHLLKKGIEKLFINVEQHQNEHKYKHFVDNIFLKTDQKK